MQVESFFDEITYTFTYIVFDEVSKTGIIIDPVLDYDQASSKISFSLINKLVNYINEKKISVKLILETHAHADHLTGAYELKKIYPEAKVGISEHITKVQSYFKSLFNIDYVKTDGSQFDLLFKDGDTIVLDSLKMKILNTPGHTPACISYLINDSLFCGDTLFMPDYGTGRCDFPAGSSTDLYQSITEQIYKLPEDTKIYTGHDYQPNGRPVKYLSTIKDEKKSNIQLKENTSKEEFIKLRNDRDRTLNAPKLLLPSIQFNINAGIFPPKDTNGKRYLKIPFFGID